MHELAADHLGDLVRRVTFVTRDFQEPAWPSDLGAFDAVVTLQAAHETSHKRHLVERARTLIAPARNAGRARAPRMSSDPAAT